MKKNAMKSAPKVESGFDISTVFDLTLPVPFIYTPKGSTLKKLITMQVYSEKITSDLIDELQKAADESEVLMLRQLIGETVESWDINWKKEALPINKEVLGKLPLTFLAEAGRAIVALWSGDPTKASNLPSTSAPEANAGA